MTRPDLASRPSAATARTSGPPPACVLCGASSRAKLFEKQGYDFVRCTQCSLVRVDPIPSKAELASLYEESYTDGPYATFAAADRIRLAHAEARVDVVATHAPEGPWLDVGCSTGAFLEAASGRGIEIDGFDVSRAAVEAAQRKNLSAYHGAVETFAPTRPYAYVTAFDVLEHIVDPGAFLDRMREWLSPGGRIVLSVPDIGSRHARLMGRHWYYYAPPFHVTYFDQATLTALLHKHGFEPLLVASAPKIVTLEYVTDQLATFNPGLHPVATFLERLVPAALRQRELAIPSGELLVVAAA